MTASSKRPRPCWRSDLLEEDEIDDPKLDDGERRRKASQLEWAELERDVQEEKRRRRSAEVFASGRRDNVVAYDDVADEEAEADMSDAESSEDDRIVSDALGHNESGGVPNLESGIPAASPSSPAPALSTGNTVEGREGPLLPEGVITAGQDSRAKKRGGLKKTGAQKRKQSGTSGHQEEKEEDAERWVKLRLDGEKKPKRIDATRIVYYHDFDTGNAMSEETRMQGGVEEGVAASTTGDFRAQMRANLFDEDDDET